MEVEQETVLALLPEVRGLTVLDAGCGSGRYLRELGDRGARVIGMDLSLPMLERARETRRPASLELIFARCRSMRCRSIWWCVDWRLATCRRSSSALTEIARVLRPGGRVIYSVVHPAGEAAGWSRTFESDGRQWAIDGFWHSVDRHRQACAAAGLRSRSWREPDARAKWPDQRAVLIVVRPIVERPSNDRSTIVERTLMCSGPVL